MSSVRSDSFIGPVYVPDVSVTVPVIRSGSQIQVLESNIYQQQSSLISSIPNSTGVSNPQGSGQNSLAVISLTSFQVVSGSITDISVERKVSTNAYESWSQVATVRGLFTAGGTYNQNIEVITPNVRRPGGLRQDFRLSFYGNSVQGKIEPFESTGPATGFAKIVAYPTSNYYGNSGSIQITMQGPSVSTNFIHFSQSNMLIGRIATLNSGAQTIPGAFIFQSGANYTHSLRYLQLLPYTGSYSSSWSILTASSGHVTLSIDTYYIGDAQVRFNGIDDFSEIAGVISASVYLNSTWTDSGSAVDNTIRLGWKSMWLAPNGWYTSANPYITYSLLPPQVPAQGRQGAIYVSSSQWRNITDYYIFQWVPTGSANLIGNDSALPTLFVPGATGSATAGGSWYFYSQIPAPQILASGGISGTLPDIEFIVSPLPRQKSICFFVGAGWEFSRPNQSDRSRYDFDPHIINAAVDNTKNVFLRTNIETSS